LADLRLHAQAANKRGERAESAFGAPFCLAAAPPVAALAGDWLAARTSRAAHQAPSATTQHQRLVIRRLIRDAYLTADVRHVV
jgi:hypothetical protein